MADIWREIRRLDCEIFGGRCDDSTRTYTWQIFGGKCKGVDSEDFRFPADDVVGGDVDRRCVWVAGKSGSWNFPFLPPPFPPLFRIPSPNHIHSPPAAHCHCHCRPPPHPLPSRRHQIPPPYCQPRSHPTSSSIMPSSSDAPRSPVPPPAAAAVAAAALSDSPPTIPMDDADDQPSSKKPRKIVNPSSSNITDDDDRIQRAALMIIKNPILTVPQVRGFQFQIMMYT